MSKSGAVVDQHGRRAEHGAVAVEFALVAPLLLTIFFGIVTFALAYNDSLAVNNAVREGARLGAGLDYTSGNWASSVRSRVQQVYFNNASSLTDAQVCVDIVNASGTTISGTDTSVLGASCSPSPGGPTVPTMGSGTCAVRVWVAKPESLNWLVGTTTYTHVATSVAAYGIKSGVCAP